MAPPSAYAQFVATVFDGEVPGAFLSSDGFAKARNGAWSPFVDAELVVPAALTAQLGTDHAAAPTLRAFLRRRQAGYYAFWKVDDRPWGQCPVVWVGGEAGGGAILGRSLDEFLSVAAWGVDPVTLSAQRAPPKPAKAAAFFSRRKIAAAADPLGVLDRAAAEYPGFGALLAASAAAAAEPAVAETAAPVGKKKASGKKKAAAPGPEAAAPAPLPPPPEVTELDPEAETEELPRAVTPPRAPSAAETEAALAAAPPASASSAPAAPAAPPAPAARPAGAPAEGPPPGSTEAQKKAWWKLW